MIKVVNPSVEIWKQDGYTLDAIWKHIARCARVCYQSVPRNNGETDYDFLVRTLFKGCNVLKKYYDKEFIIKTHLSVCEHGTVHLKYRLFIVKEIAKATRFINNPYSKSKVCDGYSYITTNMRVLIENNWLEELKFIDTTPNCPYYTDRYTVNFITDIGASRELNRHRVNSISEESTRYCRYNADKFGNNITVAKLPWIPNDDDANGQCYKRGFFGDNEIFDDEYLQAHYCDGWTAIDWYLYGLQIANLVYCKCIELGWTAQQAREILPLNTKTQVVHTAFVNDWQRFIELRSDGVSGVPHPMAKELADEVKFLLSCKSCG